MTRNKHQDIIRILIKWLNKMAVVVKGAFAGAGVGGINGSSPPVWRREITCTEVGHCFIQYRT